ncbi:MAG: hypothetical protein U0Q07_18690 [Acidimicrobiales bacterium]
MAVAVDGQVLVGQEHDQVLEQQRAEQVEVVAVGGGEVEATDLGAERRRQPLHLPTTVGGLLRGRAGSPRIVPIIDGGAAPRLRAGFRCGHGSPSDNSDGVGRLSTTPPGSGLSR